LGRPLEEVLSALPYRLLVADAVEREEVSIRRMVDVAGCERENVDLVRCFQRKCLHRAGAMTSEERSLFVSLAFRLDDGEAMSIALGIARKLPVATDDRLGRTVAAEVGVATVGTPELAQAWAKAEDLNDQEVANALRRVEALARYKPTVDVPDGPWWLARTRQP
jgi:predicted nucleic acid-binding protein